MLCAYQGIHIPDRPQINLRSWQKGLQTDINRKTPLDPGQDLSLNGTVIFVDFFDVIPDFDLGCLFFGESYGALVILSPL